MSEADAAGPSSIRRRLGKLTVSGTMFTFSESCPSVDAGSGGSVGFTATSTGTPTVTTIDDQGQGTIVVEVYQKRP
jgi:hypothetical protein